MKTMTKMISTAMKTMMTMTVLTVSKCMIMIMIATIMVMMPTMISASNFRVRLVQPIPTPTSLAAHQLRVTDVRDVVGQVLECPVNVVPCPGARLVEAERHLSVSHLQGDITDIILRDVTGRC